MSRLKIIAETIPRLRNLVQPPKVAVVLSGCGVYDGTEISEASALLFELSTIGAKSTFFAPSINQMHVIDHTTGKEMNETRNVLLEASRITRGAMAPLNTLQMKEFDMLLVPGGFGAAKNLSNFAAVSFNPEFDVNADVRKAIEDASSLQKPMGFCCIAPVLAARVLGKTVAPALTVGGEEGDRWPHAGAVAAIKANGATHVATENDEVIVDGESGIVTTSAFMCGNAAPHEVEAAVRIMVLAVAALSQGYNASPQIVPWAVS